MRALIRKLLIIFPNVLHEYPTESRGDETRKFLSDSVTMKELNESASMGDAGPTAKILRMKNARMINNLTLHLTLLVTTNSSVVSQQCPHTCYSPPGSELLMRFCQSGTECSTLFDPHLPNVHYAALKRAFDVNVRCIASCLLDKMSDAHSLICPTIRTELESNPNTSWNRTMKCLLGKVMKYGVYGSWKEVVSFNKVTFSNEFLVYWPMLKGIVDKLPSATRSTFNGTVMRGTAAAVLRKLVDDFDLLESHYPINEDVNKPVLLISEHADDTAEEAAFKQQQKRRINELRDHKCKCEVKLKVKSGGQYTQVRHQSGREEEDAVVAGLFGD